MRTSYHMYQLKQFAYAVFAVILFAGIFASCKSDDMQPENPEGSLIASEDGRITRFYLANPTDNDIKEVSSAEFLIVNPADEVSFDFSGKIRSITDKIVDGQSNVLECDMILDDAQIPNGFYFVSVYIDGELRFGPLSVSIRENKITAVRTSKYSFPKLKGEGTADNPYKIDTEEDFEYFLTSLKADACNGYGQHFEITSDITLKAYSDNPNLTAVSFQGSLNGNNHTISGLEFNGRSQMSAECAGLFSRIANAEISDLELKDVMIYNIHSGAGALAGYAKGKCVISNVNVYGQVEADLNAGGLVGSADAELHISGCHSQVSIFGGDRTGGLIGAFFHEGNNQSEFKDIEIKGQIHGKNHTGGFIGLLKGTKTPKTGGIDIQAYIKGEENVGGFVGMMDKCIFDIAGDCFFNGVPNPLYSIEGTKNVGGFAGYVDLNGGTLNFKSYDLKLWVAVHSTQSCAGGVVGYAQTGKINVHKVIMNHGDARVVSEGDFVGGIAGRLEGVYLESSHSVNTKKELPKANSYTPIVSFQVKGSNYVGGIVGYAERTDWGDPVMDRGEIHGVVSKADVTASGEIVGGVVGWMYGKMNDCVFIGNVKGTQSSLIGGIVGKAQEMMDMERCVNYSDITGGKYQGGICGYANPANDRGTYFTDCYNIGNLKDGMTVGGIVGYGGQKDGGSEFEIYACENYGEIIAAGNGDHSIGGVVGNVDNDKAKVEWSANYANIHSKTVQFVIGGVVGKLGRDQIALNDSHVTGCTNIGTVTCDKSSTKIGGVVGHMMHGDAAIVAGCVNWGSIPGDQKSDTGGILGYASAYNYIHRNWNKGKVSKGNAIVGTHNPGTGFNHYSNYYLEGSGKSWPDAISVTAEEMLHASSFPNLPWGGGLDYIGYTGEWFQMSTEGPVPMSFDFIHWDVERLRPAGWHVNR